MSFDYCDVNDLHGLEKGNDVEFSSPSAGDVLGIFDPNVEVVVNLNDAGYVLKVLSDVVEKQSVQDMHDAGTEGQDSGELFEVL